MQCPYCDHPDVRSYERDCPRCGRDCGYPNVRRATDAAEVMALHERFEGQRLAAAARGCLEGFLRFFALGSRSQAVMARREKVALALLEDENSVWRSFYDQVDSGIRRPQDTEVEDERSLADERLFPKYRNNICFAALSLNGLGPAFYGTCCITFEESVFAHRASVFEENSLNLIRRLKFGAVPPGLRAIWENRAELVAAKLGERIQPALPDDAFERLLMAGDPTDQDPDFVEVHIYGPLHAAAISRIRFWPTANVADGPIRKQIIAICERRKIET